MRTARSRRSSLCVALVVGLAASAISAVLVLGMVNAANPNCCPGQHPYMRLYDHDRSRLEAFLVTGDAQAFAGLAQDPTLARPENIDPPAEYAYRAQRPTWSYLAWAGSLGQPALAGWALVLLEIASAGLLAAVVGLLCARRGASPWIGLIVVVAGLQSLSELTPELLATALVGLALLCTRERRAVAIALLCAAALTRESMLIAVAMWALYELVRGRSLADRVRTCWAFALPFVTYALWAAVVHQRLGNWPWSQNKERLVAPLTGIIDAAHQNGALVGFFVAVTLCVVAWVVAKHDVLTWIAAGYLTFAIMFSADVWLRGGYQRTLVPLFVFATAAVAGGLERRRRHHGDALQTDADAVSDHDAVPAHAQPVSEPTVV
jgi:hypothetical protein